VVVHQGRILGEGYHERYGQGHAEVNALAAVAAEDRPLLSASTLYVSLEPCFHYGKTPPCVDLVLRMGIPRVVIGAQDPFPAVAGQSIAKLRAAGVEVLLAPAHPRLHLLHARFFTTVQAQRPYIVLKFAQSADGFLGYAGQRTSLSNALVQRLVHRWRSEEAAILVGSETVLVDDPALTNRLYLPQLRQPTRLLLDRRGRIPSTAQALDDQAPSLWFSQQDLGHAKHWPLGEEGFEDWLKSLYQKHRLQSVLVEGGAQLLTTFLETGLWDELRLIQTPKRLGQGVAAPKLPPMSPAERFCLGQDEVLIYYREPLPIAPTLP
jgi:diaminohydroxyphosphoribosylaminopyrimidine deaminase/5-amino-6-(5-phosphoribosylamino)uracil reductase